MTTDPRHPRDRPIPVLEYAPPLRRSLLTIWIVGVVHYLAAATLLGGFAWGLTWLLIPAWFSATAIVRIPPPTTGITYQAGQNKAWLASQTNVLSTATATMTSPTILNSTSKKLIGAGSISAADWAGASIQAQLLRGIDAIRLEVRHRDPKVAHSIASEVVESFLGSQSPRAVPLSRPLAVNQLRPQRNRTWPWIAAALGSAAGMIALFLYRQRRVA